MAGAGKKTFTAGEVLTASDVNTYLMEQSVMVFGGTAARSSAIPTPSEGMVSYRTDVNGIDYYNGSAWVGANGLDLLNTTTFTSQAFVSISSIFSSIYKSYLISFNGKHTTGTQNLNFRFRSGSTDNSSAIYKYSGISISAYSASVNGFGSGIALKTEMFMGDISNGGENSFLINVNNPFIADYSSIISNSTAPFAASLDLTSARMGGVLANTTSYDGFTIFPTTGSITGSISVYGVRNS